MFSEDNSVGVHRSSQHSSSPGGSRGGVVVSQGVNTSTSAMSEWPTLGEVVADEPLSSNPASSNGSVVASPKSGSSRETRGSRSEKAPDRGDRGGDRGNGDHDMSSHDSAGLRNSCASGGGSNTKGLQGGGTSHGSAHGGNVTHTTSAAGSNVNSASSANSASSHNNIGGNNNGAGGNNSSFSVNKKKGKLAEG